MDLSSPTVFWTAYTACNILALIALVVCLEKPLLARLVYSLFFGMASVLQAYVAFFQPDAYLELAKYTLLPIYKSFMLGWFAQHTQVFILGVATLQLWVALSIWGKGWVFRCGVVAGILLLALLLPMGLGAAFPAPLNLAIGLRLLMSRRSSEYLWPVFTERYMKTKSCVNG